MTMGKPYTKEGPSAEDKALDLFADMMIEKRLLTLRRHFTWTMEMYNSKSIEQ